MGIEHCALWGQSDGSNIICRIALQQDPRVDRAVLQACSSLSPRPPKENGSSSGAAAATSEEREGYIPSLANARAYLGTSLKRKEALTDELVAEFGAMI